MAQIQYKVNQLAKDLNIKPKDIVDIINHVNQSYKIDYDNIFAYGFSAGGGMSPVLAATYPAAGQKAADPPYPLMGVGNGRALCHYG